MRDGDAWVPCYDSLRRGARRGLPRAVRMVFLELALEVRAAGADGSIRLPFGFRSDVDALHDMLGGDRREVARAIEILTQNIDGDGPMIVLSGPVGARIVTIPSFTSSVNASSSRERMRRLRDKRRDESRELTNAGDVTPASLGADDVTRTRDVTCDGHREEERREEKKRSDPPNPPEGGVTSPRKEKPEREVFAYWLSRYREIHPKAKEREPDPKTEIKPIAEALRRGFTVDDLRAAIDGMFADEWNRGANDRQREYLDVHVAMKPANTDRFRIAGLELRDAAPRATYRREQPNLDELSKVDPVAVKASIAADLEALKRAQDAELFADVPEVRS